VVVIEHHTGLLAICDELVELGPGGGEAGGRIIAQGSARELSLDPASITGPWLRGELAREVPSTARAAVPASRMRNARPAGRASLSPKRLVR
jgi:excinuclease ABC subunit A